MSLLRLCVSRTLPALLALSAVGLSACVTQQKYDEMSGLAKSYHDELLDLQQYQNQINAENARLKGELAVLNSQKPIDAAYQKQVDARIAELTAMLAGLGQQPEDVSVFPVEGGVGYSMKESILFDSGSDEIKAKGKELLLSMSKEIEKRPFRRIWVRGHTDSDRVSKPETVAKFPMGNLQLSAYRALRVADLLVKDAKLSSTKVCVQGLGPNEPISPNDSAAGKQRNRRVELYVLDESAGEAAGSAQPR